MRVTRDYKIIAGIVVSGVAGWIWGVPAFLDGDYIGLWGPIAFAVLAIAVFIVVSNIKNRYKKADTPNAD